MSWRFFCFACLRWVRSPSVADRRNGKTWSAYLNLDDQINFLIRWATVCIPLWSSWMKRQVNVRLYLVSIYLSTKITLSQEWRSSLNGIIWSICCFTENRVSQVHFDWPFLWAFPRISDLDEGTWHIPWRGKTNRGLAWDSFLHFRSVHLRMKKFDVKLWNLWSYIRYITLH